MVFFPEIPPKMPRFSIQPARAEDLPTIGHLARQIWPVAYARILSDAQLSYMLRLFYSPQSLAEQVSHGQQFFILHAPQPIGFAAIGPAGDGAWKLHKLYVLPQEQGKGLGRALLHFVLEKAKAQGAASIILQVNRHNPAKDFYTREGFHIAAEKDFDIGEGFFMNDYVMERPL